MSVAEFLDGSRRRETADLLRVLRESLLADVSDADEWGSCNVPEALLKIAQALNNVAHAIRGNEETRVVTHRQIGFTVVAYGRDAKEEEEEQ